MNDKNLIHLLLAERADYVPSDEAILRFVDALHPNFVDQDCWAIRAPGADGLEAYAGASQMDREFLGEEIETLGADLALIAEPLNDERLRSLIPAADGERSEAGLSIIRATDFLIPPHSEGMRYRAPRCRACGKLLKRTHVSIASECGHCGTATDMSEEEWNLFDYWDGSLRRTPRTLFTRTAVVFDCSTDWPPFPGSSYPNLIHDGEFLMAVAELFDGGVVQFPCIIDPDHKGVGPSPKNIG